MRVKPEQSLHQIYVSSKVCVGDAVNSKHDGLSYMQPGFKSWPRQATSYMLCFEEYSSHVR